MPREREPFFLMDNGCLETHLVEMVDVSVEPFCPSRREREIRTEV
jgi:hypothetical protein